MKIKGNTYRLLSLSIILTQITTSCQNRRDIIAVSPTSPSVKLLVGDSLYSFYRDSLKLSKSKGKFYGLDLRLSDSDRLYTSLTYGFTSGFGKFLYRTDTVTSQAQLLPFESFRCQVRFFPSDVGLIQVSFVAKDQLKKASSARLELFAFDNLLPVAKLSVIPLKGVDPFEYLFDASNSYDQDKNFGGIIVQYIYAFEGQVIKTSANKIKHIFSSPGIFTVSLQTKDNDGALSSLRTEQVLVN